MVFAIKIQSNKMLLRSATASSYMSIDQIYRNICIKKSNKMGSIKWNSNKFYLFKTESESWDTCTLDGVEWN